MRVAIDIRRAGNFGIGTYIRNIVNQFARTDRETEYLLIGQQRHLQEFDPLPCNFKLLEYASDPGSFHTHMHLPFLLRKHGVDILHMPWFYAPAVAPSRLVITVHDLTDVLAPRVGASPLVQAGRMYFAPRAPSPADPPISVLEFFQRGVFPRVGGSEGKNPALSNTPLERGLPGPQPHP